MFYRFCMEPYHPFSELEVKKYVIGDDYKPVWEVNTLSVLCKVEHGGPVIRALDIGQKKLNTTATGLCHRTKQWGLNLIAF